MVTQEQQNATIQELLISALSKLLIEKGIITPQEFLGKVAAERVTYQQMLNPTRQ